MAIDHATLQYYQRNAEDLVSMYDKAQPHYLSMLMTELRPTTAQLSDQSLQVLDVGCGSGRDVAALRAAGVCAWGVDASARLIAEGTRHYQLPAACLSTSSLPRLREINGHYDAVLCSAVLQHIPDADLKLSLQRLCSLCKPGGHILISVPARYPVNAEQRDANGRYFAVRPVQTYSDILRNLGMQLQETQKSTDGLQRPGIAWQVLLFHRT